MSYGSHLVGLLVLVVPQHQVLAGLEPEQRLPPEHGAAVRPQVAVLVQARGVGLGQVGGPVAQLGEVSVRQLVVVHLLQAQQVRVVDQQLLQDVGLAAVPAEGLGGAQDEVVTAQARACRGGVINK